jgi:hypothetical protein
MKIKQTIERECCKGSEGDLKPYKGLQESSMRWAHPRFCMHCGQIWYQTRESDAAGGTETVAKRSVLFAHVGDKDAE